MKTETQPIPNKTNTAIQLVETKKKIKQLLSSMATVLQSFDEGQINASNQWIMFHYQSELNKHIANYIDLKLQIQKIRG